MFAIASLGSVSLQAGYQYILQITSDAGQVDFFGSYSASALGGNGQPGVQVESLNGTTPAVYPITPPVANPRNWIYAASVQNRGSGGIIITILDVTESQESRRKWPASTRREEWDGGDRVARGAAFVWNMRS
jgi:hypothetical protein